MLCQPKVSVYTQVYNTEKYLARCIESVLGQTYGNFEYVLIDNGSTDGCRDIIARYAAQDRRIKALRIEPNYPATPFVRIARQLGIEKYFADIDSDDWLEPNFLEHLINLAEQENLDIVCTGTSFHDEGNDYAVTGTRRIPQRMVWADTNYPDGFLMYHAFFRTVWGKLVRREAFVGADYNRFDTAKLPNGGDTLLAFAWLRQAKRMGVDNSLLHHYLLRRRSVSHVYNADRFRANVCLHEDAVDFLAKFGPISDQNKLFLAIIFANNLNDTLQVLLSANISAADKLTELRKIAEHPVTKLICRINSPQIQPVRNNMVLAAVNLVSSLSPIMENYNAIIKALCQS